MLNNLTWLCHICGRERPDDKISVFTHERMIGNIPMKENVRYCNDNPDCAEKAKTFSFIKAKEDVSEESRRVD